MLSRPFKVGERVKVTNNTAGHNFAVGMTAKIAHSYNNGQYHPTATYQLMDEKGSRLSNNIYHQDLELCAASRADILKEAESLRSQIAALDAQIAYLDETKSDQFDDLEWRCYKALKAIKDSTDTVETSKVVAKLVRNEM